MIGDSVEDWEEEKAMAVWGEKGSGIISLEFRRELELLLGGGGEIIWSSDGGIEKKGEGGVLLGSCVTE